MGLWHSLCSSLKLQVSGIAVYLLPLLQIQSCFLLDAWLLMRFFASTSLQSLKRLTSPTLKVPYMEFLSSIQLGSLTSVVLTLGPDFQKVVRRNHSMTNPNTPKTMWQAYLSSMFYFFLERLAWAALARSRISGSVATSGSFSLGDLDLAILYYILHVDLTTLFKKYSINNTAANAATLFIFNDNLNFFPIYVFIIINRMGLRLLHLVEPLTRIFPSVEKPIRAINTKQKLLYTSITLFIYLVCCQIPLYGVLRAEGSDPFMWMRVILASNRGTLMQLGLSPVISAGWILQLLIGTGIITADMRTEQDNKLFESSQKLLAMILAFGQAFAYVWSGAYGNLEQIGLVNACLIILQLTASGFIVILLDEMLQKGYGMGSGVSLFIAVNICENILWKSLSPITLKSQYGTEFEGALIALVHLLITKPNKISALYQAFYRTSSPNLTNLLATAVVFFLVIYLQGFRVNLKLSHKKYRGYEQKYPIKLFYTSNISVIFQTAFVSNMYFISQILYKKFKGNWIIGLLGTWQEIGDAGGRGGSVPVSGLAYWISPPRDLLTFVTQPIHALVYTAFVMVSCAFFSRIWLQISKQSPRDIAKKLKDDNMFINGYPQNQVLTVLNKYIPVAAACGGMIIGLLSIFSDLIGVIGSGTGILLSVSIVYGYYQKLVKDKKGNMREEVY